MFYTMWPTETHVPLSSAWVGGIGESSNFIAIPCLLVAPTGDNQQGEYGPVPFSCKPIAPILVRTLKD